MTQAVLGIIGVYDLPRLENVRDEALESPWGVPSAPVHHGTIDPKRGAEEVTQMPGRTADRIRDFVVSASRSVLPFCRGSTTGVVGGYVRAISGWS